MKNILCFGDSITWGFDPVTWTRYELEDRWTTVLQNQLGSDYYVTVDALSGRTTCWDLPYLPYRSGKDMLPMILECNAPLDLVIIMLGTNDMIGMLNKSAKDSTAGLMSLLSIIDGSRYGSGINPPETLVISPPVLGKQSDFMNLFFESNIKESGKLAANYKILCNAAKCSFLDSNEFVKTSDPDGVHLSRESHKILGMKVAAAVKGIFG